MSWAAGALKRARQVARGRRGVVDPAIPDSLASEEQNMTFNFSRYQGQAWETLQAEVRDIQFTADSSANSDSQTQGGFELGEIAVMGIATTLADRMEYLIRRDIQEAIEREYNSLVYEAMMGQTVRSERWTSLSINMDGRISFSQNRQEADTRSRSLLLSCLTPEQKETFEKQEQFEVTAPSGRRYKIQKASSFNVVQLDERGNARGYLCAGPTGVPIYDQMLAQKCLLESDEALFLEVANKRDKREEWMIRL